MWADLDSERKNKKKKKAKKQSILGLSAKGNESESDDQDEAESDSDDGDDATNTKLMQQTTGNFLKPVKSSVRGSLPKTNIDIKQCSDANKEEPHQVSSLTFGALKLWSLSQESNFPQKARLKSVEFHPTARVLLTAGLNQTLSLFQVSTT